MSGERGRRTRGRGTRGQTTQDFAIGISVFLLTIAFTFAFVPSIFTPFSSDVTPGSSQHAARLANGLIDDYSIDDRPNWLNDSFEDDILTASDPDALTEELKNRYGLPEFANINITVEEVKDVPTDADDVKTVIATAGDPARGRPTASVSRIVVIEDDTSILAIDLGPCSPPTNVNGNRLDSTGATKEDGQACRIIIRVW